MSDKVEIKQKIVEMVQEAETLIPAVMEPDLPPQLMGGKELLPGIPARHEYESMVWDLGEKIRQLIKSCPALQNDEELYSKFLPICLNRNAKRGRQSFIMLFGYKRFTIYAKDLATQIDDTFVEGHIIDVILKMKAPGYENMMEHYVNHKNTWMRNTAKMYLAKAPY